MESAKLRYDSRVFIEENNVQGNTASPMPETALMGDIIYEMFIVDKTLNSEPFSYQSAKQDHSEN